MLTSLLKSQLKRWLTGRLLASAWMFAVVPGFVSHALADAGPVVGSPEYNLQMQFSDPVYFFALRQYRTPTPSAKINYHAIDAEKLTSRFAVLTAFESSAPRINVRLLIERNRIGKGKPSMSLALVSPKPLASSCTSTCSAVVTLNPKRPIASAYKLRGEYRINKRGSYFLWSKQPVFDFVTLYKAVDGFEVEVEFGDGSSESYSFSLRGLDMSKLIFPGE